MDLRSTALQFEIFPPAGTEFVVHERISARARQVRVEIRRDGAVVLVIPRRMSRAAAWRFLEQHRDWAERKSRELRLSAAQVPPPAALRWDGHDRLWFEGREVRLRVERGAPALQVAADAVVLRARRLEPAALARALRRALVEAARSRAIALLQEESARLGCAWRGLRIGDPVSLWGSCGPNGRISLSWRLLLAPPDVFRYVVIHELCHLRWRSHGPRFWGLVERQMPGYAKQRRWLREHGAHLHAQLPRS